MKGELTETAVYRRYYLNRLSANASFRKYKLELKGNFQYNQLKTWEGNDFNFLIPAKNIQSAYSVTAVTTRPQFIGGAGAYYQFNDGDYISANSSFRSQRETFPIYTSSYLKDPAVDQQTMTGNFNHGKVRFLTSNVNYNNKLKSIHSNLFVGAQHTLLTQDTHSEIYNATNGNDRSLTRITGQAHVIRALSGKADFESTFSEHVKLEAGAAVSHAFSNGGTDAREIAPPAVRQAEFGYQENSLAVYSGASGKVKKLSYSGGVRLENNHTNSRYQENGAVSHIDRKSTQLFPKADVSIPIDSSSSISVKYARNITRPDYSNANQYAVYINPYFEWANNINLRPSVTEEVGVTFQRQQWSVALSLYQVRGPVYSYFDYDDNDSKLRRTDINYDYESGVNLSVAIPFKAGIWTSTNVLNGFLSSVRDAAAQQGAARPYFYFHSSNQFNLPHDFVFTLTGWAVTKSQLGAIERSGLYSVDSSVTRKFKKFSCSARFNNMFRSIVPGEQFAINEVAANGFYRDNSRAFALSFSYSIGKLREARFTNKDVDENLNRVN